MKGWEVASNQELNGKAGEGKGQRVKGRTKDAKVYGHRGCRILGMGREVWIGVVRVRAMPGYDPFGGAKGAHVNAMAYVESADDFRRSVAQELKSMGMMAEAVDDLGLLESKIEGTEPTAELFNVMEEVKEDGGVKFDDFEPF